MKTLITAVTVALLAVFSVPAELAPGTTIEDYLPTITATTIEWQGDVYQWQGGLDEYEVEETKFKLKGEFVQDTGFGLITLQELEFDPDPLVSLTQIVENNTASPQSYTLYIDQPAYLATASSSVRGSVVVTLLDKSEFPSFDGSSFTDSGTPVYKAFIDGNQVDTLMDPNYSLTTVPPATTTDDSEEFGWDPYGAGVVSNIAIQIDFTLSAGDSATIQSRFEVIPEPATLSLIGLISAGIYFTRRFFAA